MSQVESRDSVHRTFETHLREVTFRVRAVLAELASATGVDVGQPRAAARQLDIDKMLVWKISKVVIGRDPVAAMSMFPGAGAQRALLVAFERAGASAELVERARAALGDFQRFVEEHADDRETFEMMLSAITKDGRQSREEARRKLAFQGNSAIWGLHCRVRAWAYVVCPSDDPEFGDVAVLGSFVDVRRLRRDTHWTLATIAALGQDGRPMQGNPIRPLYAESKGFDGVPTLPEFCRGPIPPMERVLRSDGITHYRLNGGEVGNTGAFTWAIGWRYPRAIPRWRSELDRHGEFALNVLIPAEVAQLDLFVHKAFWPKADPEMRVFSLLPGESQVAHEGTDRQEVHLLQSVERLHEDPLDLAVHDVPNYSRMFESAFAAMGHGSADFAGFRARMKYPVLSTSICLRVGLPNRPKS